MNLYDYIGETPLIRLNSVSDDCNVYAKLEYLNPWGSLKDRIVKEIINNAEKDGILKPGMHIVEATSGNTGISLAGVCAQKGYSCTIILPEFVSYERKLLLALLGANIILTKEEDGLAGTVAKSIELSNKDSNIFLLNQTKTKFNPIAHEATALEIIQQLEGHAPDILIASSGTGGHISGIGKILKQKSNTKIIAVEPSTSAILSGKTSIRDANSNHGLIGIGPGFIPETLTQSIIDDVVIVNENESYEIANEIMIKEGILIGASSGAAILAAKKYIKTNKLKNKNIVLILASSAERYLSTQLTKPAQNYVDSLIPQEVDEGIITQLISG